MKKVYNPEKESSFFYGPAAYLMLLYVNTFKFDHLQVTRKRPTVFYWTSEKIRFLEDILQESGGFGCGHVNEAYVEEEFQESEYNEEESGGDEDESDDYGNDFLNDDENVEDYDQGKCSGGHGGGSGPHEGNIGKGDDVDKNNDLLSEKEDEDDEQGNGSGCNKEEAMNLNFVVENVTKSVGLIDSQEGVSFGQIICDPIVESFLKTLDEGTDGCINHKQVEDDVNENLTGFDDGTVNLGEDDHKKKVISDHTVDKVIVAKKDGEGEDVEVHLDLAKEIEDCSNKNKDGETVEDSSNKNKDSNETQSLKN
ncbi:unnamed protein product [Lactuca virosa]|uniref:Uncharacterized protein n=1 Tax=Lactuca virosa TaxID=75947 RepID=A0AAU9LS06_9ASTR|nr:unnamed protein product [Lactuca virosa]